MKSFSIVVYILLHLLFYATQTQILNKNDLILSIQFYSLLSLKTYYEPPFISINVFQPHHFL